MPRFPLKLGNTYWSKGFFNVSVDFERFLTMTDGALDVYLGDAAQSIVGRISRTANRKATPRIYGNKPLAQFFQTSYRPGEVVQVEIVSPTMIRVGGGQGARRVTGGQRAGATVTSRRRRG